jgi:hypothetical protein
MKNILHDHRSPIAHNPAAGPTVHASPALPAMIVCFCLYCVSHCCTLYLVLKVPCRNNEQPTYVRSMKKVEFPFGGEEVYLFQPQKMVAVYSSTVQLHTLYNHRGNLTLMTTHTNNTR